MDVISPAACSWVSQLPVRTPWPRAPLTLANSGDIGIEQAVVGSLGGKAAQGAQIDIDARGGHANSDARSGADRRWCPPARFSLTLERAS